MRLLTLSLSFFAFVCHVERLNTAPLTEPRFRNAALAVLSTLRSHDENLSQRLSQKLSEDTKIILGDPLKESPPSPHVTLDLIERLKHISSDKEFERAIVDVIKDQAITDQEIEIQVIKDQHGRYKYRTKCSAVIVGTLASAAITAASTILVAALNRC